MERMDIQETNTERQHGIKFDDKNEWKIKKQCDGV